MNATVPAQSTAAGIKAGLIQRAQELGFAECRVALARPAAHRELYERWIAEGEHGDMAWMARNVERRGDPREVLPGARSVVVLAMNYYQGSSQPGSGEFRIARYAWNDDYHDMMEERLRGISAFLDTHGGVQKFYVDTGPVLERDFASDSGIGWNGKSTMQIHRRMGTWFFLCEVITTLDLPADASGRDMCGKCTRCIDACPTGAITSPRHLDARKCISYLTIEHKGPIPVEHRRAVGNRLYGCDDCLDACPWNRFAQASREAAFQAREPVFQKRLADFLRLSDEEFRALFARSPIKRIKRDAFLRNVCVVLGNTGAEQDIPELERVIREEGALIAEHAAWAIAEIRLRRQAK